jgi:hypothetical protein
MAVSAGVAAGLTAVGIATTVAGMASIVSGVASMAGNTKVAKIAGIIGLGAGAFSLVAGASGTASAAANAELYGPPASAASVPETSIEATLAGQRGNTAISDVAKGAEAATASNAVVDATPAAIETAATAGPGVVDTGAQSVIAGQQPYSAGQSLAPTTSPLAGADGVRNLMGTGGETVGQSLSLIERAGSPVQTSFMDSFKKVGALLKENKELVDIGGGMLKGAFGPENKKLSLLEQQFQMEQEQINRQNANANNLVGLRNPLAFNLNAPPVRRT